MRRPSLVAAAALALALTSCEGSTSSPDSPGSPSIVIDQPEGAYPHKVHLEASLPGGFDASSVRWDVGDGSGAVAGGSVYHVFWAPGTYDVVMTARASDGHQESASTRIDVTDPVPGEYRSLYQGLTAQLRHADERVSAGWDGTLSSTIAAAWNLPANSHAGDVLLDPGYYDATLAYLDALAALGVKAIVVEIDYPSLTPGFNPNVQGYIDYFRRLGEEVQARGLLYVVEQNSLLPGYSALPVEAYYRRLRQEGDAGKVRWGQERYEESRLIMSEIRPDYYVLIEEPTTHDSGLGITLGEWVFHITALATTLKEEFPGSTTRLGAGCGAWEDRRYTEAWAAADDLDFVELHMYPLASPSVNYFDEMLERLDRVRGAAPQKELLTVEGWLYKASEAEVVGGVSNADVFARDVYGFWAPLDQRFLETSAKLAQRYGFVASGPAWTRYFFAYLDFSDPALDGLSPFELLAEANRRAGLAAINGEVTSTGRVFENLAQGTGFAATTRPVEPLSTGAAPDLPGVPH